MADGVDMTSQQLTSIGYGSTTADVNVPEQALYHGLNAVVAQLGPAANVMALYPDGDGEKYKEALILIVAALAVWLLFAMEYEGIDPLYGMLITSTTIGYGDLAPGRVFTKYVSALVTPALVHAYNNFWGVEALDGTVDPDTLSWCGGPSEDDDDSGLTDSMKFFQEEIENKIKKKKTTEERGWY